jgi:hypothetical protein
MAAEFPLRPRLQKGELQVYEKPDQGGTRPDHRIVFQYNPETLRRSFAARSAPAQPGSATGAPQAVLQVPGPPVETVTISIALDAADQSDAGGDVDTLNRHGLLPVLARLELLLYPPSMRAEEIERQAEQGQVQVSAATTPLVMLAWGQSRVMPVQLTSFSVTEEAFDPQLNPIAAKVELSLKVLTYVEFPREGIGRDAFIGYQKEKESLARKAADGRVVAV